MTTTRTRIATGALSVLAAATLAACSGDNTTPAKPASKPAEGGIQIGQGSSGASSNFPSGEWRLELGSDGYRHVRRTVPEPDNISTSACVGTCGGIQVGQSGQGGNTP